MIMHKLQFCLKGTLLPILFKMNVSMHLEMSLFTFLDV